MVQTKWFKQTEEFIPIRQKSMFDANEKYLPIAANLEHEVSKLLKPIFIKYQEKGYTIRDISHILMLSIMDMETERILTKDIKSKKV